MNCYSFITFKGAETGGRRRKRKEVAHHPSPLCETPDFSLLISFPSCLVTCVLSLCLSARVAWLAVAFSWHRLACNWCDRVTNWPFLPLQGQWTKGFTFYTLLHGKAGFVLGQPKGVPSESFYMNHSISQALFSVRKYVWLWEKKRKKVCVCGGGGGGGTPKWMIINSRRKKGRGGAKNDNVLHHL